MRLSLWLVLPLLCLSTAHADPVCVVSTKAILRKGPGAKFPMSWTVTQNMPLMRVGPEKKGWLQVQDLDGETHWVSKRDVSSRYICTVVKSKSARLRKGPGTEHPIAELNSVDRYTPFRKIDRDGAWLLVQDEYRARYWVHETNVWLPSVRAKIRF